MLVQSIAGALAIGATGETQDANAAMREETKRNEKQDIRDFEALAPETPAIDRYVDEFVGDWFPGLGPLQEARHGEWSPAVSYAAERAMKIGEALARRRPRYDAPPPKPRLAPGALGEAPDPQADPIGSDFIERNVDRLPMEILERHLPDDAEVWKPESRRSGGEPPKPRQDGPAAPGDDQGGAPIHMAALDAMGFGRKKPGAGAKRSRRRPSSS